MKQRKSAIITHMPPPSLSSLPFTIPSLQIIRECQAGFPVLHSNFSVLSLLHLIEYTCWCYFLYLSHFFFPPLCPQVHFLYLDLIKVKSFAQQSKQSVQFSCSIMSNSLQPHGLQHARLPCPSPTPRACSNSWPSSRWCHPTILSSVIPSSSRLQSFPALGSFPEGNNKQD